MPFPNSDRSSRFSFISFCSCLTGNVAFSKHRRVHGYLKTELGLDWATIGCVFLLKEVGENLLSKCVTYVDVLLEVEDEALSKMTGKIEQYLKRQLCG